jgi:nitrogen fixation-related uncharacterized protein
MNNFLFWQKWLFVVSILTVVLGLVIVVSAFWSSDNGQIDPDFYARYNIITFSVLRQWFSAMLGAVIAGWGVCLIFIAHYPFKRKESWSWHCVLLGLSVWFVLDTALSLYLKVYFNAIFNTVLFGLALLPLVFTRKHFISSGPTVH